MTCETSFAVEGAFAGVRLGRYGFCSSGREETYEGRRYVVIVQDGGRSPSAVRRVGSLSASGRVVVTVVSSSSSWSTGGSGRGAMRGTPRG
ncbi:MULTISPECIES: hypothetical protein [Streptomyces]|uniref:Uncharacterized protein n=1 Tax=Streptomyces sudanensis TaxID=436397 RepID=A0ABY4TBL7_9ACTN|nr:MULTISPECIES: hypothetical protein [Streptomyces]URN16353.1 hypothetical protein MW084_10820 [Streptomyces sudanensis]